MHGKKEAGKLVLRFQPDVRNKKNSSGKTPLQLYKYYLSRLEKEDEILKDKEHKDTAKALIDDIQDKKDEYTLAEGLFELSLLKKKSKKMKFRDLAKSVSVNYESGEAKEVTLKVIEFIEKLAEKIGEMNDIYKGKVVPLGSSSDDVRVGGPDEVDFNLILKLKNVLAKLKKIKEQQEQEQKGKKRVVLETKSKTLKHLLKENAHEEIDGYKFREEFYKLVKEVIPTLIDQFEDKRLTVIYPGVKKTGVGVGLTLAWTGTEYPLLLVDVDLVPVIQTESPEGNDHPLLTTHLAQEQKDCSHTIVLAGRTWTFSSEEMNAVYVNCCVCRCHGKSSWRFSTALLENYIMRRLSKNQRDVYIIIKFLITQFKPEGWFSVDMIERYCYFADKYFSFPAPPGYILKTAFFLELEEVKEESVWEEDFFLQRIRSVFVRMSAKTEYQKKLLESLKKDRTTDIPQVEKDEWTNGEITREKDVFDSGYLSSYFSPDTQRATRGPSGHIIYKLLAKLNISDFI